MEFESVMMAKAALDYLTICIEVLTQVRARDREKRREEERRESNDEKTIASAVFFLCSSSTFSTSFRPSASFFSPFISLSLSLSFKKKKKKKKRLRLRSVPPIDEIGGPIEGLTCIVTGPTR